LGVCEQILVIPRLHEKAGSTSWLLELATRAHDVRCYSQFCERTTSARRAPIELALQFFAIYTVIKPTIWRSCVNGALSAVCDRYAKVRYSSLNRVR